MLSVDDALRRVVEGISPLAPEWVRLEHAEDRVLATEIASPIALPPFANSAMDGYAVVASDTLDARVDHPVRLRVVARIAAGEVASAAVTSGLAMTIMTGAALPDGADAVVKHEDTLRQGEHEVGIHQPVAAGANVRQAGEDLVSGALALRAGAPVTPATLALLAAVGIAEIPCARRPRVALCVTGGEIVPPGQPLPAGKIYDGNSAMLAALVRRWGGEVVWRQVAPDDELGLRETLRAALATRPDLLVTTGGVSVGDFDLVKRVLAQEGTIAFWQVNMRPGRPLVYGAMQGVPVLGLPGNVVAAFVGFQIFGRVMLAKMLGRDATLPLIDAVCAEPIRNGSHRHNFLRGVITTQGTQLMARQAGGQGPQHLSTLALSNCLIVASADVALYQAGDVVQVLLLEPDRFFLT